MRCGGLIKMLHVPLIIKSGVRLAEAWLILQVGCGCRDSRVSYSLVGVRWRSLSNRCCLRWLRLLICLLLYHLLPLCVGYIRIALLHWWIVHRLLLIVCIFLAPLISTWIWSTWKACILRACDFGHLSLKHGVPSSSILNLGAKAMVGRPHLGTWLHHRNYYLGCIIRAKLALLLKLHVFERLDHLIHSVNLILEMLRLSILPLSLIHKVGPLSL